MRRARLTRCARPIRMLPGGRSAVREFKVGSTEMPVVWLGTSVFAGAGGFAEKAEEYHSRFYDNPDAMYELMDKAAGAGWGIEGLAMPNIIKAIDRLRESHPKVPVAYTCGITDFATEVNSALKRQPRIVFLHPRVTDTATAHDIELYFRRVVEEWVLPAAATHDPLKTAAKLEDTACRALLVPASQRGAELEHSVATVQKYGLKYFAEVQPVGTARDIATSVHATVRSGVDALVIGITTPQELDVYMKALTRMGFLE
jgi:hypothetical protein